MTSKRTQKLNKAILASVISTPVFLPTAAKHSFTPSNQNNEHQSTHKAPAFCFPVW